MTCNKGQGRRAGRRVLLRWLLPVLLLPAGGLSLAQEWPHYGGDADR